MTEIWSSILKQIEGKLDPKELKTWFGPTRQIDLDASPGWPVLTVSVPSRVFADWIESRHGDLLSREAAAAGLHGPRDPIRALRGGAGARPPRARQGVAPPAAP